jgi:hypothetical protein
LSHNHLVAFDYTLGRVADEASLIIERESAERASEASLLQLAIGSMLSPKSRTAFTKRLEALNVETKPVAALFSPE